MIINKASYERGFMHGKVYKTSSVEIGKDQRSGETKGFYFQRKSDRSSYQSKNSKSSKNEITRGDINELIKEQEKNVIDSDGVVKVGTRTTLGKQVL